MRDFVEVTVTVRVNGQKVERRAAVDPEVWATESLRETQIRAMKEMVLDGVGERLHWRIEAVA